MKDHPHVVAAGGLLSRDMLNRVSTTDPTLAGTKPTDYGLVPGERAGDAVTRSWNRLVGVWANFRHAETRLSETDRTATALTRDRWLKPLLEELDFHGLSRVNTIPIDDRDYPISHQWKTSVPVHQLGWRVPIDSRTKGVRGAATEVPAQPDAGFPQPLRPAPVGHRHQRPGAAATRRQRVAHPTGVLRVRPASHLRRQHLQRLPNPVAHLPPHPVRRQPPSQLPPGEVEHRSYHVGNPRSGSPEGRSRKCSTGVGKRVSCPPGQQATAREYPPAAP